ncbi:hypothetical protein ACIQM4_32700 [Streptomyces sp. NPDC091272]|uniref:hypothetical protein n=1 Tax=Streptomyces sp. NPDC091272 TaxID=3365981 RepID=UPI00381B34D9
MGAEGTRDPREPQDGPGPAAPPPPALPPYVPPPPDRPPVVGAGSEADPVRAVGAGLLNLSGLGLGYVLLRQWAGAAICLAATAVLLFLVLPADVDGTSGWLVVGYLVFLVAAALDGARRALRASRPLPVRPYVAVLLGVVLIAVPAGGGLAYGAAQDEAVEKMLLGRLAGADRTVARARTAGFAAGESDYRAALAEYGRLAGDHPGSRAAKLVPDRLDSYYKAVSAPYGRGEHCAAVAPLKYLRTVPGAIDKGVLGKLAGWPDRPLALSLYECGMGALGVTAAAGGELGDLMRTFPASEQAAKVEPGIRARITDRTKALGGGDPCPVTDELRKIGATAGGLPGAGAAALRGEAEGAVESGVWACGLDQFRDRKFAAARATLTGFAATYRGSGNAARARTIAVAAEIAVERPAAGDRLPPTGAPGGARMPVVVSNDAPSPTVILYTGPVTGTLTIPGCTGCSPYPSTLAAKGKACKDTRRTYPKGRLMLPAGDYHLLYKSAEGAGRISNSAYGQRIQPGYTYTGCSYETRGGLQLPGAGTDVAYAH